MNKNQENYKKAVDQIHVSDELKEKVLEKANKKEKNYGLRFLQLASGIAAVAIIAVVGMSVYNNNYKENLKLDSDKNFSKLVEKQEEALAKVNIKRFSSVEELKETLKKNQQDNNNSRFYGDVDSFAINDAMAESTAESAVKSDNADYSRTNSQVENVDEADIVKTDGNYIYYVDGNKVIIVDAKSLTIVSEIKDKNFTPNNIFVNNDKIVVLGNCYEVDEDAKDKDYPDEDVLYYKSYYYSYKSYAKAFVYDISNRKNPTVKREIALEGSFSRARMIDDNVYFMATNGYFWRYDFNEIKDDEILPKYIDSEISNKIQTIEATDIAYFENSDDYNYSMIAGFNINNDEKAHIETFLGAGGEIYVSENNMYVIQTNYSYNRRIDITSSIIYKFKLEDGTVTAVAKGEVPGYINDQFSVDEYEGNLRIVTTIDKYEEIYESPWDDGFRTEYTYTTQLTILDNDLNQIGVIENLKKDERVYSVRFIGKVGYIVTFEQVDPLFVVDLSDPKNPKVKGELEIPGYSSYLHPIDETHIIGIGYNTKPNGYGGITNDNMKMSMFDVSDLENPKEIFKIDIGKNYAYSSITYEHKALFYKASENLIGFPAQWNDDTQYSGLVLYRIDLENNRFIEITDVMSKGYRRYESIQRAVYIGDTLYTISYNYIKSYSLKTFEELEELELDTKNDYYIVY